MAVCSALLTYLGAGPPAESTSERMPFFLSASSPSMVR